MKKAKNETKNISRLIALFMCALIFSSCTNCVSCNFEDLFNIVVIDPTENDTEGDINQIPYETQKQTTLFTEDITFEPPIPIDDLDFEGLELSMLIPSDRNWSDTWRAEKIETDTDFMDVISATETRNKKVLDKLNITVKFNFLPCNSQAQRENYAYEMIHDVIDGYHRYDIVLAEPEVLSRSTIKGIHGNLLDKKLFPYFDFSQQCWNQSIVNGCTVNGKLYSVTGDMNLETFDNMAVVWCNVIKHADIKNERLDKDCISAVKHFQDGTWTYEELYRWAKYAEDETLGIGIDEETDIINMLPLSWNVSFVSNDGREPAFSFASNSTAEKALSDLKDLFGAKGCFTSGNMEGFATDEEYVFFISNLAKNSEDVARRREMNSMQCLLPLPKYDLSQPDYFTTSEKAMMTAVLNHSVSSKKTDGRMISSFLQLMYENSWNDVIVYYFNEVVKQKYFGTDDKIGYVGQIIDAFECMRANLRFDLLSLYPSTLTGSNRIWSDAYNSGKTVAEVYTEKKEAYENEIKALLRYFE